MCCDYRIFLRYKQRFDKANAKSKDQSVYSGVQHWRLPYRAVHKQSIFKAAQRQKGQTMNYMNNNPIIIGIDHGYGNIKTAHCCFPTGVIISDKEPTFKSNLLVYNGSYYTVGEGHKEFISDKMTDGDYYILTLAAIARELNIRKQTSARVHLAAGLPLTWVSEQKDSFKAYLLQNEWRISFSVVSAIMWSLPERTSSRRASPLWRTDCGDSRASICFATLATER